MNGLRSASPRLPGGALLVENAPGDAYWGVGKDGNGKNRLGVLLMEVREWLR